MEGVLVKSPAAFGNKNPPCCVFGSQVITGLKCITTRALNLHGANDALGLKGRMVAFFSDTQSVIWQQSLYLAICLQYLLDITQVSSAPENSLISLVQHAMYR